MRESQFQAELKESFYHYCPRGMYIKLPDMPRSKTSRFIPTKPFDILLILQDKMIAIETKLLKNGHTSINLKSESGLNMMRQVMDLQHVEALGGDSYLMVEVVGKFRGMAKKVKECYFFTPINFAKMIKTQKAFSVEGVRKYPQFMIERVKGYWKLAELLKG